jgi:hypothetical protein
VSVEACDWDGDDREGCTYIPAWRHGNKGVVKTVTSSRDNGGGA